MKKTRLLGPILALLILCSACVPQPKAASRDIFAMDTFMSLAAYDDKTGALDKAAARIQDYEALFSVTKTDSDISRINQNAGSWVALSPDTFALLTQALELCRLTDGALDITAYPAVKAWGFTTGEYRVPGEEERTGLTQRIDYTAVELDETTQSVRIPEGMELDLGAVAKGWTGQRLHDLLKAEGITSAMLVLGGNVQSVGAKPDGSLWRVGIQDPASDEGAYLASLSVADMAVVTSGGYQRFFEENGQTYWHILDPDTAAPARSGVLSATIIGPDGGVCDALSTALFILGADGAKTLWNTGNFEEFDYVLVLEDGSVELTAGIQNGFALAQGYEGRKVTVVNG